MGDGAAEAEGERRGAAARELLYHCCLPALDLQDRPGTPGLGRTSAPRIPDGERLGERALARKLARALFSARTPVESGWPGVGLHIASRTGTAQSHRKSSPSPHRSAGTMTGP